MSTPRSLIFLVAFVASVAALPARAAESYDGCRYVIAAVPATLSAQGVYCLQSDIAANLASGDAILVTGNNITIECNDFKLGNLAAGPANTAVGIRASNRMNTTVRGCNVRGFRDGIALGGSGHLVERNRLDGSLRTGISVSGGPGVVQGNRVYDTGPAVGSSRAAAIRVMFGVDVIDNTVAFVQASDDGARGIGIDAETNGVAVIRGNRVRDIVSTDPAPTPIGIYTGGGEADVTDNYLSVPVGIGIACADGTGIVHGNRSGGSGIPAMLCADSGGNIDR